jgi:tetratricopeptide (TPR) repeat protein
MVKRICDRATGDRVNRRTLAIGFAFVALWFAGAPSDAAFRPGAPVGPDLAEPPFEATFLRYSAQGSRDLLGLPVDPGNAERELSRLAAKVRVALTGVPSGARTVDAFRRVLLAEEGFSYDKAAANPENYLLESVLARKRGNCLGLSMLYLALSERLGVPFRGVYVPSHCFVRYEGVDVRVNVEFSEEGAPWEDERYRREFRVGPHRPYLSSLGPPEMLGVFLKSLGAGYSRRGREADALRLYEEAGRLYPGLPDVHYNAGVSLQKLGRQDEAIAKYRRALALDPDMTPPRDNLSLLLAEKGRYAEAIEEARRVVELEPGNARVRAGLARAYFALGSYPEAARECDRAEALGCRFEPSMLEALSRYRDSRSGPE